MSTHVPARFDPDQHRGGRRRGQSRQDESAPSRLGRVPRPRRVPYLLLGVVLVIASVGGGVVAGGQLSDRQTVLALERPVTVGQQLTAGDLRKVSVAQGGGVAAIPADRAAAVAGKPVAYSLPKGALLTEEVLGEPQIPPAGQALAAVGLRDGQFPPRLQPGNQATVVRAPDREAAQSDKDAEKAAKSWPAVVVEVLARETSQTTVVVLQLARKDARALAAAEEGRLRVVVDRGGGR
ncbi:hypothetical protein [Streptomyces boninensis]|uniref:hypothetical protein n=1 Tax=Streptomyces boninensis TaxID=2039455 RepID=UPI003B20E642